MELITNRRDVIQDLIERKARLDSIESRLSVIPWDSEIILGTLRCGDLVSTLRSFISGEIPSEEVERWANLIEGREDIQLDANVKDVLFELANPLLTVPLTKSRAQELVSFLDQWQV